MALLKLNHHTKKGFTPQTFPNDKSGGFTIVEMLVVLAIIATVSGSLIVNSRAGRNTKTAKNSAHEASSVLRKAQNSALSGERYNSQVVERYKVSFDTSKVESYKLCADIVGDSIANSKCTNNIVEDVEFLPGAELQSIHVEIPSFIQSNVDWVDVGFEAPFGNVYIEGPGFQQTSSGTVTIFIKDQDGGTRSVKVDAISGGIEIE